MKNQKNLLKFHKMHALGNDFVICDSEENKNFSFFNEFLRKENLLKMGSRFEGIGFDQLIFLKKNFDMNFDYEMFIFNQDGSNSSICGNATRCCVFLINKLNDFKNLDLKIKSGEEILNCNLDLNEKTISAKFQKIKTSKPVDFDEKNLSNEMKNFEMYAQSIDDHFQINFEYNNLNLKGYYANIGNPHLVFFINDILNFPMKEFGTLLTNLKIFRDGINIGFCEILDSKNAILKVFERGVGLTFACGSGACAAGFLAYQNKFLDSKMIFHFLNQDFDIKKNNHLEIQIDENKNIIMKGFSNYVFYGFYEF